MKRVLVITYYWPPSGGSGVQRWVKFAKYLPQEGWQPVIYTPENPELTAIDSSLLAEVSPQAEVIRRPIVEPYGVYRRLMGRGGTTDLQKTVTPISSGRKSFSQRLSLWIRGNVFVPDPRVWWVKPSVRFLTRYLKEHPVDVIVTTGPPHSMHLIGQALHRRLQIPWIPDFRDPWTKMYYLKHLPLTACTRKRLYSMEQAVLDEATDILTVTPLVQEDYAARTSTHVSMIPNGYDPDDFDQEAVPDGHFNLVHTGLLASDGNPETLWTVLSEMCEEDSEFRKQLRIRLIGKVDGEVLASLEKASLAENVVNVGYLDHRAAVREQLSATLLLLPLRNDPDYRPILPGKLFEYLASRRPILGIGQEDGAMARVVAEEEAGTVLDWGEKARIKAYLGQMWELYRNEGIKPCTGQITRFTRASLTHSLAQLLDKSRR